MEFPHLQKLSRSLNPETTLLISVCTSGGEGDIHTYLSEVLPGETPHFCTVYGKGATDLYHHIRSRGFPSNFIVDKEGMVRFRHWHLLESNLSQFQRQLGALASE